MATDTILGNLATQLTASAQLDALNLIYTRLGAAATETTGAAQLALATTGIRGQRRDVDTTPVANGESHVLYTNAVGRLKVSATPAIYDPAVGNITTAASVVSADVTRASNVAFQITGTFVGVNVTFEGSIDGGTSWFVTQAVRTNANTVESVSGVVGSPLTYAWEASVHSYTHFRVRATAWTSGTGVVQIVPAAFATEPAPAIQSHPVTIAAGAATIGSVQAIANNVNTLEVAAPTLTTAPTSITVTTAAQVAAVLTTRKVVVIYNPNAVAVCIAFGNTVTTTAYTTKIQPSQSLTIQREQWSGVIFGVMESGAGTVLVTVTS